MNDVSITQAEHAKYLGIHLDKRLSWRTHILALGLKQRTMRWLIGPQFKLSLENKFLFYKTIVKPVWNYGAQLYWVIKPHIQQT